MFSNFDFNVIERSWKYLFFDGMAFTLQLTLLAMLGGIIVGTILALCRLSKFKVLSMTVGAYVNLVRSIPLVLVIFWFYFLVPYIGSWAIGLLNSIAPGVVGYLLDAVGIRWTAGQPIKVGAFSSCLITFIMFEACYYCEIMRAGVQSIARGQMWAGYALGLNYWQVMGSIVLPQAFRNMTPVLLTQTIVLFQDVSLVYVLSISDFVGAASKVAQRDGRLVEMYLFVALVYFVLCFGLSSAVKKLENKIAVIR